jgi:FkbM family methyltransferase
MKKYLRSLVEEFPHAAAESYHVFGWRGVYLATCAFVFRYQPFATSLPGFGKVHSRAEAINLIDNFSWCELRSEAVENHLRSLPNVWVVDVGVNVGVTCRWWLSLGSDVEVIGVDMFQEALDFAKQKIGGIGQLQRWHPICGAVGDRDGTVELRFSDPLEGTSRLESASGDQSRKVRLQTLDALLDPIAPDRIGLLKLDIEGSAGRALVGATKTLRKCDYVVVETHSDGETKTASSALIAAGFQLFRCHGRTMWWCR